MAEIIWDEALRNMPFFLTTLGIILGGGISVIAMGLITNTHTHRHFLKHHLQDAALVEMRGKDEKIRALTAERDRLLKENQELSSVVRGVHESLRMHLPEIYLVKPKRRSG